MTAVTFAALMIEYHWRISRPWFIAAILVLNLAAAFSVRRHLASYVTLETCLNLSKNPKTGENIPFPHDAGARYAPNWLIPAVAVLVYLFAKDRISEFLSCLVFALTVPTCAIKLVGERRI